MPGLFDPLWKGPSRFASGLADKIDDPQGEGGMLRGGLAGMIQGAGDVASDMTSPFSLATSAIPAMSKLGLISKLGGAGKAANRATAAQELFAAERAAKPPIGGNAIWGEPARMAAREGDELATAARNVPRPGPGAATTPRIARAGTDANMMPKIGGIENDVFQIDWPGNVLHGAKVTAEGLKRLGLPVPAGQAMGEMAAGVGPTRISAFMERMGKMDAARRRSQRLQPGRFNPE